MLLPTSLLVLISSFPYPSPALELPWPHLGRTAGRYFARQDNHIRREPGSPSDVVVRQPIGVRKMSEDEGEMFFPEYWNFDNTNDESSEHVLDKRKPFVRNLHFQGTADLDSINGTDTGTLFPLQAPYSLHKTHLPDLPPSLDRFLHSPRALFSLEKRQGKCPSDTFACTSINQPNQCCGTGATCQSLDGGQGNVGCCSAGQCSEDVAPCQAGYESCPSSSGGGCCMPGFSCVGQICQGYSSTVTVVVEPTVTASSSSTLPSSTLPASTPPSSGSSIQAGPASFVTTSTSTHTDTTSTTLTTTSPRPSSSSDSPTSTASSTSPSTPAPAPVAPVRATSDGDSTSTTTTAPTTTVTPSFCPTGFYACSAYYNPGCCRLGRDCSSTSCPPGSSSTVINSNGVTVEVNAASTSGLGQAGCALGWYSCAVSDGGKCCPSGYGCGTSCTATGAIISGTVTGTAVVAKENGGVKTRSWGLGRVLLVSVGVLVAGWQNWAAC